MLHLRQRMTKAPPAEAGIKIVCENRKARHNYFIEDRYEAGIVLTVVFTAASRLCSRVRSAA